MVSTKLSYRFWVSFIPLPFLLVFTVTAFLHKRSTFEDKVVAMSFMTFFTSIAAYRLHFLRHYTVDTASKTLISTRYFSKATKTYSFSYFDSVISTLKGARGGPVRVSIFVRDGAVIFKMTGEDFKNLDVIESNLKGIKITRLPRKTFWDKIREKLIRIGT